MIVKWKSAPKVFCKWTQGETFYYLWGEHTVLQQSTTGKFIPRIFPESVPELKGLIQSKLNISTKEVVSTDCSLCSDSLNHILHFESSLFLVMRIPVRRSKHSVSSEKQLAGDKNWPEMKSAPKVFSRWFWQHSPAFTGWEQCFGQQNSNGRFTPIILPNNVSALKIQTLGKLNLSTKQAAQLMFSVGHGRKINALWMSEFYEMNSYYGDWSTLWPLVVSPHLH